jgi:DNA-binding MarR family transcriptional regulator
MEEPHSQIEHVGWQLWRSSQMWKRMFESRMAQAGFPWMGEARGAIFQHIGRHGVSQTELVRRAGLTKQAVQQHLDDLAREGIICQVPHPTDSRRKIVTLSAGGIAAENCAKRIKREIESHYRAAMGEVEFATFKRTLDTFLRTCGGSS